MHRIRSPRDVGILEFELNNGIACEVDSAGRGGFRDLVWKGIISIQLFAGEELTTVVSDLFHVWLEIQSGREGIM